MDLPARTPYPKDPGGIKSLVLASRRPELGYRRPIGESVRGVVPTAEKLRILTDSSVIDYRLVDKSMPVFEREVLFDFPVSPISDFDSASLFFGSQHGVFQIDDNTSEASVALKARNVVSVDLHGEDLFAASYSHSFVRIGARLKRQKLPVSTLQMLVVVCGGSLYLVDQWACENMQVFTWANSAWKKSGQFSLNDSWHFPTISQCKTKEAVFIGINKHLYEIDRKNSGSIKVHTIAVRAATLCQHSTGMIATDGLSVVRCLTGEILYSFPANGEAITTLAAAPDGVGLYVGTTRGGVWYLEPGQEASCLLPAAAFHGSIEVRDSVRTISFSSQTHQLEIDTEVGGGMSLMPERREENETGNTINDLTARLQGSRVIVREFGERVGMFDVQNVHTLVAGCGKLFAVDQANNLLVSVDGLSLKPIFVFEQPISALEIRSTGSGVAVLARHAENRDATLLRFSYSLTLESAELICGDVIHLMDGTRYLVQEGHQVTLFFERIKIPVSTPLKLVQAAALVDSRIFLLAGGEMLIYDVMSDELQFRAATVFDAQNHGFLTHNRRQELFYDPEKSERYDSILVPWCRKVEQPNPQDKNMLIMSRSATLFTW